MWSSLVGWTTLATTQPVVWAALAVAALLSLPLLALLRLGTSPRPNLRNAHLLITGGSEGIGYHIATLALARGAKVTLIARTLAKLEAARRDLLAAAPDDAQVAIYSADVGDAAALKRAVEDAGASLGPIDIAIAAAGAADPRYFEDLSEADFLRMLRVNYLGVVNLAHSCLSGMVARRGGHFCALSSMAAAVPFIGYAAYAPAKAATRALLDVLRNEYADTPVRFHVAFPPDTNTPGFAKENETKPYETSHIWPEMFNETFEPVDVARDILDGILAGDYFCRSPDVFGNLLVARAWGHFPRARPLLEAAIAPLFVGLHEMMVWMADRAVRKRAHHRALASSR